MSSSDDAANVDRIAIIGMAGRFPGAKNVSQFWRNLCNGVESIVPFMDEELISSGIDPSWLEDPSYVRAGAIIEQIDRFDAAFFGYSPREAEIIDPQQRLFLECAWEALEVSGYNPDGYGKAIGVYAGTNTNTYLMNNLYPNRGRIDFKNLQTTTGNEKDYLTTRVSYKLNLTGPSITVQTACSTSLVAVHLACDALLNGQCDMALAGGVCISVPQRAGYFYSEGSICSPDGHCRAFDADGQGTVFGSGVGIVVLKRLADAIEDGDTIDAVILGSAINNDGSGKMGYTAPSATGQAEVIQEALGVADVDPQTITYVEAHGTGTPLGDPIEVAALTQAFGNGGIGSGSCAIGSVKTNIGHLNTAAGVAGLIKTALALKHRTIPACLNFSIPNPKIDFNNSPFYVNTILRDWKTEGVPRRAGVSSFGVGGTNAHIVLEESPKVNPPDSSRSWQLLLLSARTNRSLDTAATNLAQYLNQHPELNFADVAYTLKVGRKGMNCRRILVCRSQQDAVGVLQTLDSKRIVTSVHEPRVRSVAFMFTGQGAQYIGMGHELYETEHIFRKQIDRCSEVLKPHLGLDLRSVLYPGGHRMDEAIRQLTQTEITQPALFVIEYALACLLMEWGIEPQAMIGHSIGEYVAACLAGVFSLEEGLLLVATRGRLMTQLPAGSMLAVPLSEKEVQPLLGSELSLAAVNAPSACVVSGPTRELDKLVKQLADKGIKGHRLQTSHAFHSRMMEPILNLFKDQVRKVKLNAPKIPYLSNVTGTWITKEQAVDPNYWESHLRYTVRFSEGLGELLKESSRVLLEVGPGKTLSSMAMRHRDKTADQVILSCIRHQREQKSDVEFLLSTMGRLWLAGIDLNWAKFYERERRHRVVLPTYPFERQRYWVDSPEELSVGNGMKQTLVSSAHRRDISDWFYVPLWKRSVRPFLREEKGRTIPGSRWLVFVDACGVGAELAEQLERQNQEVFTVMAGEQFAARDGHSFTIRPGHPDDYIVLIETLARSDRFPVGIVHMWTISSSKHDGILLEDMDASLEIGFYSLLYLSQALGRQILKNSLHLCVVSNNIHDVTGDENLEPAKATILGPCKTIPQEYTNIICRCLDVEIPKNVADQKLRLTNQLLSEINSTDGDPIVAYRGRHRWVPTFEPVKLDPVPEENRRLRKGGVYLITGGMGGLGLVMAEYLARTSKAKLVLVGRSAIPDREQWEQWLTTNGKDDETSRRIQKVRFLEELGAAVIPVRADVTNLEQMREAVAQTMDRFGKINGVIHGAGVPGGGVIQLKSAEVAAKVLAPKVRGTIVLDEVLKGIALDWFVIFSSTYAITSRAGQVDYCAANSFLDAFAHYKSAAKSDSVISINWDGWREVGMAVNTAATARAKSDQLETRDRQVGHPLLDKCILESADLVGFRTEFSIQKNWVLAEHQVGNSAVVPGVAWLEMARAGFEDHKGNGAIEISEVFFTTPLSIGAAEHKEVYTILERVGEQYDFRFLSRAGSMEGGLPEWEEHSRGKIRPLEAKAPVPPEIGEILKRCDAIPVKELYSPPGDGLTPLVQWGARWRSVRQLHLGKNEALAELELPLRFAADLDKFIMHPALLDLATGIVCSYASDGQYLPFSYERLKIWNRFPAHFFAHIKYDERLSEKSGVISFDVLLLSKSFGVLAEAKGVMFRRVENLKASAEPKKSQQLQAKSSSAKLEKNKAKYYENMVSVSKRRERLDEGILSSQGVDAFQRILVQCKVPQVIVSTTELRHEKPSSGFATRPLNEQLETETATHFEHVRPDLKTAYIAPINETERILTEIWQEVLGIAQVGTKDDFFELGGDSVIAIQIIAKANKAGLHLAGNHIFEHPTISALAAVGVENRGGASQTKQETNKKMPGYTIDDGGTPTSDLHEFNWSEADHGDIANAIKKSMGDV